MNESTHNLIARSKATCCSSKACSDQWLARFVSPKHVATGNLPDITDSSQSDLQRGVPPVHDSGSTLSITVSQSHRQSSNWNAGSTQRQPIDEGGVVVR